MTRMPWVIAAALAWSALAGCSILGVVFGSGARHPPPAQVATGQASAEANSDGTHIWADGMPRYEPAAALTGTITSIGASTTTNLVARVAAEFKRLHPSVTMEITASPASIGPQALLEDRADIVPMGRPLTPDEVQGFAAKHGYPPTEIKVAADALVIFVEKRNPLPGLTLGQVDRIFSRTQRRGGRPIDTWGQAGLTAEWADRPITLYGYGPEDDAYQIFQQQVLQGGAFRLSLRVEGGGSSIVQGVAADAGAIGFASNFYAAKRVRAVPLAGADGQLYAPTEENVRSRNYPLIRFLYICVNKPPGHPFSGPAAEFLRFLLSREGQQVVADGGNIPLDAATVVEGRQGMR